MPLFILILIKSSGQLDVGLIISLLLLTLAIISISGLIEIDLITELGLIGFVIVCFLFIVIFYHFRIIFISLSNKEKIIFFGYLNCILINLWPLVPSGSFFNNWNSIVFWLPIGLVYSLWNKKIHSEHDN